MFPKVKVVRNQRVVDDGNVVTSQGVSAGIDMAFHVIARLLGSEVAKRTSQTMEYDSRFIC